MEKITVFTGHLKSHSVKIAFVQYLDVCFMSVQRKWNKVLLGFSDGQECFWKPIPSILKTQCE